MSFKIQANNTQMPNLDGLQSTRLIREMGYSAPIVALTAFAEESNVKECLDSGMDFFLPKPIRRPALKQVLKRYCATIEEAAEEPDSPPMSKKSEKDIAVMETEDQNFEADNTPGSNPDSNTDSSKTLADRDALQDDGASPHL